MPEVKLTLTELGSDLRSNEVALRFTFENADKHPINIHYIVPRVPDGVKVSEPIDKSIVDAKSQHSDLCKELSSAFADNLILTSDETLKARLRTVTEYFPRAMKEVFSINGYFKSLLRINQLESLTRAKTRLDSLSFKISGSDDASQALTSLVPGSDTPPTLLKLLELKTEQLRKLELSLGPDGKADYIARVEPNSFYAFTYLLKFPRRPLDSSQHNVDVEVSYSVVGEDALKFSDRASAIILISPSPVRLSIITMIGGLLGVVLKVTTGMSKAPERAPSASSTDDVVTHFLNPWRELLSTKFGVDFVLTSVGALILALIFFNIYEYTELGKKLNARLGWRSALFIGTLCGLFSERIMKAFSALIGQ